MELAIERVSARLSAQGYRHAYAFRGPPGGLLVQQVASEIDFLGGEETLVRYRGVYAEYFRLGADGTLGEQVREDVHELDLRRDGWTLDAARDLLRRAGLAQEACPHERHLRARKTFLLAPGLVADQEAQLVSQNGAEFGFLATGPGGEAWARVTVSACGGGGERSWLAPTPLPGSSGSGSGWFAAEHGWRLEETFRYAFSALKGRLDGDPMYEPTKIRFPSACIPAAASCPPEI